MERRPYWPREIAEPAWSIDVLFGSTPPSTRSHTAHTASGQFAPADYLVSACRHDNMGDWYGCLFRVEG
jgi:hypothetical protein